MRVVRVAFDGEASASFFFVVGPGWPVAGPFARFGSASAARAWIGAHLAGLPPSELQPQPTVDDVAVFGRRWDDATADLARARLYLGRVRARRWVRGLLACDNLATVDPCWRTAVERATRSAPHASRRDVTERGGVSADVSPEVC